MRTTRLGFLTILILTTVILVLFLALWLEKTYHDYSVEKYEDSLRTITGVKSVSNLYYEGTSFITMELNSGSTLRVNVHGLDYSIFTKTDWITLESINGLSLDCRVDKSDSLTGVSINIISFIKATPLEVKIENVDDLINNLDVIYRYIQTFPTTPENAKLLNMDNRVDKNTDHWCHVNQGLE